MFRRISALIVFVLILGVGCAALARSGDDADYTDIVLLKNGGKIQGKIVENNPDKKLVIERRGDYQRFEVPRKRIYAVTTVAEFDQVKARFNTEKPTSEGTSMFRNITQIGMIFGSGNRYFSALIINGVEFENGIILGAGLGFDAVEDGMVPLVAHIESNSSTGSHSMFLYGEAGYSFCWQKEGPRGGWLWWANIQPGWRSEVYSGR